MNFVQNQKLFKKDICSNLKRNKFRNLNCLNFRKENSKKERKRKKQRRRTTWAGPTLNSRGRSGARRANARRVGAPSRMILFAVTAFLTTGSFRLSTLIDGLMMYAAQLVHDFLAWACFVVLAIVHSRASLLPSLLRICLGSCTRVDRSRFIN
jgi:hypothetical protein